MEHPGRRAFEPLRHKGLTMDYLHLGIAALAAVMVWLLYSVTRETRRFLESDERRIFRAVRATRASPRHEDGGEKTR